MCAPPQPPPGVPDLLLGLVDVGTALAQVEVHLVAGVAALHLQQRRVLPLVPQTTFVAGEDGFGPQSGTQGNSQHRLGPPAEAANRTGPDLTFQALRVFSR